MASQNGTNKIEKNVNDFIDRCAHLIGKAEADLASQELWVECSEKRMESPIEHILYCAIKTVARLNLIEEARDPVRVKDEWHVPGLSINPQAEIDRFRADFVVSFERHSYGKIMKRGESPALDRLKCEVKSVLVECDSQEFHERSERERRYEKARDRFFIGCGHHVFHFTGAEIVKEPFRVAKEILAYVTGEDGKDLLPEEK